MLTMERKRQGRARAALVRHWPLALVMLGAIALRAATSIAYRPALFYQDSWRYGSAARWHQVAGVFVPGFDRMRPSGYPAILDALALISREAALVATVQHVAGLVTGLIVYALTRRLGAPRWLATAAAAIVLLDSYAIALEHHILSEAFFGVTLIAAFYLVTDRSGGWTAVGASGLLLALATTIRTAALFAVPVWLAYVVITGRGRGTVLVAVAAVFAPLLLYATAHSLAGRGLQMVEAEGWFLYGRVGGIADCGRFRPSAAERPLCNDDSPPATHRTVRWFLWDEASPANQTFGPVYGLPANELKRSNDVLRGFAVKAIKARPAAYVELVATDFARFFKPGRISPLGEPSDDTITFRKRVRPEAFNPSAAREFFTVASPPEAHPPADFLRAYQRLAHTPRWLLGGLSVACLLVLLLGASRRLRPALSSLPEVMLLIGAPLLILLGSAATASSLVRYLVPLVPLFVCAGVVGLLNLWNLVQRRESTAAL
jgi:hypothetical protein